MNISHIPPSPGVYLFKNNKGQILYVGKAKNLAKRVSQYFTPGSVWKQDMVSKATRVDFIEVTTESEALYLEDNLIKTNSPEYNRLLKGDNSYVYLKITKEDFPQLFLTRMRKNDGCTYIGPKNNTGDLKKLMHYLRQIYKYRSMKAGEFKQGKLSSDVYFGLDKGRSVIAQMSRHPERSVAQRNEVEGSTLGDKDLQTKNNIQQMIKTGLILDKSYTEYKEEYRQIVRSISSFFEGNTKEIKKKIIEDIQESIKKEHFERCAKLRDILHQVDARSEKQHVVLDPQYNGTIVRITPLQNFWVIILVKIFEGKMTDVIREKKSKHERSLDQMKSSLESDFGDMDVIIANKNTQHIEQAQQSTFFSASMKKIKKDSRKELDTLFQKFLDSYIASTTFDTEDNLTQDLLSELQKRYNLTQLPYQIECVDISHLSGSNISGGLSCMREGFLYKAGYRQYKIKLLEHIKGNYSNDFLSLQEVIVRRFGLKDNTKKQTHKIEFPNLFILDGGKGQLNILRELCQIFPSLKTIMTTTTFIALGKGKARKEHAKSQGEREIIYSFDANHDIVETPLRYDTADLLLTKLRDEAHRFANQYRTKRMSQEWK